MNRARSSTALFHTSADVPGHHDQESARLSAEARDTGLAHAQTYEEGSTRSAADDLDEAIRASVLETSKGNPDEDAEVERAIRASMAELYKSRRERAETQHGTGDEDADLKRALEASVTEAHGPTNPNPLYDEELERALAQSLKEQRQKRSSGDEWDSDEDEDYNQAIQASQNPSVVVGQGPSSSSDRPPAYDPGHLAGTTEQEFQAQQAQQAGEKTQQQKTEEQIVMDYVKKQSLLEEEHRKSLAAKAGPSTNDDDDDEELQQALKMSMQSSGA